MAKLPNSNARTFEQICDYIRTQIAAGVLKAGDKLPAERDMAEKLRVGRNAVREALRSLEMAGVVTLEKGRTGGAYICPPNSIRITVAMSDLMNFGSIGLDEVAESRTMLMELVTRLVCERASSADFDNLEQIIDETAQATKEGNLDGRAECIARFYACLGGITGNRVLMMMTTALSEIVRRLLDSAALRMRPLDSAVPAYRSYLAQLRNRSVQDATVEMRKHLITTHKVIQREVERVAGISSGSQVTLTQRAPVARARKKARVAA
jgi:GntR family transcriptional regulator, transcriptional repressor for pyruvate dehydrogenase complex